MQVKISSRTDHQRFASKKQNSEIVWISDILCSEWTGSKTARSWTGNNFPVEKTTTKVVFFFFSHFLWTESSELFCFYFSEKVSLVNFFSLIQNSPCSSIFWNQTRLWRLIAVLLQHLKEKSTVQPGSNPRLQRSACFQGSNLVFLKGLKFSLILWDKIMHLLLWFFFVKGEEADDLSLGKI